MASTLHPPPAPLFVGDHLALDFINTHYGVGSKHCDWLRDDNGVLGWLKQAGLLTGDFAGTPKGLLRLARELRQEAKDVLAAAKSGRRSDAAAINRVLEQGRPRKALQWDDAGSTFTLVERRRNAEAASLLEPVAAALVDLLTNVPLDLVRQCEADDCTLLFRDSTKSHRRRWCSMAACGNRMKVAAFRSRNKAE